MVLYHVDRPIEEPLGTMTSRPGNKRPSLTRAETIESCNSDDLVTVLEVHDRKPYKIMDRSREIKKGVMAESLLELIERVLGPPSSSKSRYTREFDFCTTSSTPLSDPKDFTNDGNGRKTDDLKANQRHVSSELTNLLERLERNPGLTALLATHQLELLAQMDIDLLLLGTISSQPSAIRHSDTQCFDQDFLHDVQTMAYQYLAEKSEIRDAVGLLKLHQHHPPLKETKGHQEKREDGSKKAGLRPKKKANSSQSSSCTSLINDNARNGKCPKNTGLNTHVISVSTTVDNPGSVRMLRKKEEQI
ncbi:hypothetical protein TCAL_15977 [Tigriopus californicus]|uniref:CIDE-N domain-containing protein n=1 Tax=Tigriopus californicus TaxID=6832 RepID=A0A553PHI1_TIGCA|nr:hypothetical protein TCAL_15977 [Tigriopus californicus]